MSKDVFSFWLAHGRRQAVCGKMLNIVEFGSGEPVMMLHGFPTWSLDWAESATRLGSDYRVIAPDFLGYGLSDKPRRIYSTDEQADLITAILAARGLSRVALVAHDFGVIVAQELIRRSQAGEAALTFASVTLLNAGIVFQTYRPTPAQRLLSVPVMGRIMARTITSGGVRRGLAKVFGDPSRLTDSMFEGMWAGIAHQSGHQLADRLLHYNAERRARHPEWERALSELSVSFGLVWGMADPVSGAHVLSAARAAYPRAKVTALNDAGHFPQLERPKEVAEAIIANISEGWAHA